MVAVTKDITDQREQQRRIEHQNERLDEYASVVSHDLRSPLNVAEGHVELARERFESEDLEAAADAIERCHALIDDLMVHAREGEELGQDEWVDLGEMVRDCWNNVDTADGRLDAEMDATIRADGSRLRQLLENIFRNAIDHGGTDVTLTVGQLEDGFYVADDGPGIPAESRDQVFEFGYSTAEDGTGFGLSIVEGIAEAHGWTVKITDSNDGGARFEITDVEVADC